MATPSGYRAVLSGEARAVDVVSIEQELTQLWKAAAEDTLEGQPVVRACVANLIAYATGAEMAEHINEVISQSSGRHPSRSIVVVAEPEAQPDLRAAISAHCQIPVEGGRQVCSEQITLHASGPAVDELHGTILPLLVPDLSVLLWWHDEPPFTGHLFRELLDSCDRLIVDSADFAPERAARALIALERLARQPDIAVSDLNWSRLTHWRELIAQFFDAPPMLGYLDRLDRVEVQIASLHGRAPDLTEGALLVAWLASRLGWTFQEDSREASAGGLSFRLRSPAGTVGVELVPDPNHPDEGLHSVRLTTSDAASFSIARSADDPACADVVVETPEGSHARVVHLDIPSEGALLCDELDLVERDAVFEQALSLAVQFVAGDAH